MPFSPISADQTVLPTSSYPLAITIPSQTTTPVTYHQDFSKVDHRLQDQTDSSNNHPSYLQPLSSLPPYTTLQGSLHHRALLRAASIYAYHDLTSSNSLPMYFPQM